MSVKESKAKNGKKSSANDAKAVMTDDMQRALEQTPITYMPLSALVKSPLNVRTIPYSAESVSGLAETIFTLGLLQNLVVHAMPEGIYGVAAGGRRLSSMELLVERGLYLPEHEVAVKVVAEDLARAVSLAENSNRQDMHPAEQIVSFRGMAEEGKTAAQIGAQQGFSPRHVQRMLKLAGLAPSILEALAKDELTTDHCHALALEDDQARQVEVLEAARKLSYNTKPEVYRIRNLITDSEVSTDSDKFRFVGESAFKEGEIRRDLFSANEGGYVNSALLSMRVDQKLQTLADALRQTEGWAWALGRTAVICRRGEDAALYQVLPEPDPVYTDAESERAAALHDMLDADVNADGEALSDEESHRMFDELQAIESAAQSRAYSAESKATLGVVVSFSTDNRQPDRELPPDAMQAVNTAISVLSDNKTRFTYGDLLLTAHEAGEAQQSIPDLRMAIDKAIGDNLLAPLDSDKGVFTSHIHLLDELSVQALASDVVKEGKVVSFTLPEKDTPAHLKSVEFAPIAILNAPASIGRLREVTEEIVTMSREHGRDVKVLASSVERGMSLGKSSLLKDDLLQRSRVLDKTFALSPQSTLVVEGAERLGLKEVLVLTGEAKEKNAQLIFLDSAGRQSNANALSVLSAAGVSRHGLTEPAPGLEARVVSIGDKRDRYRALAERYADLSSPDTPVTASVVGAREQQQLTGIIRDALQNAGKLGRDSMTIEARTPVFVSAKAQRLPATYRDGMVLEDRSDKNETRHYVIDRVHEETRMLSLIDNDGVLSRMKLSELSSDWRLFEREQLSIAEGEQLFALAGDKSRGLKARDRLTVTAIENGTLTLQREGQKKPLTLATDRPLYVTHGYVSAPGSRDNERGVVLASLNARDLTANMMNALSQSGNEAEIFTGEAQNRAEDKLGRMRTTSSPLSLVRQASGKESPDEALSALKSGLSSDAQKAVRRAIGQMSDVAFDEVKLLEQAGSFYNHHDELRAEVARQVKEGDLMPVTLGGHQSFVSRAILKC